MEPFIPDIFAADKHSKGTLKSILYCRSQNIMDLDSTGVADTLGASPLATFLLASYLETVSYPF